MINTLNWDELVVARYGIARANHADMSVADSMIKHNIVNGKEMQPVGDIPKKYTADWPALKTEADRLGEDDFYKSRIAAYDKATDHYGALGDLWNAEDYDGMVALMKANVDGADETTSE